MPQSSLDTVDQALRDDLRSFLAAYATTSPPRSIAVVGNAPVAPDADRARRIDEADLVLRLNSFAIDRRGDPPSHGTKVDVVVFSRGVRVTPHFFDHYSTRGFLMTEVAQVWWTNPRPTQEHFPRDLGYWCIPNRAVIADLRARIWAESAEKRVDPTTGTVAAWLGYSLFPGAELLLTGFSFLDLQEQTSWQHHASGRVVPVPAAHRVSREGALLVSWVESGRATVLA